MLFYLKKNSFFRENKAIFINSNGLDPKPKFPHQWLNLFNNEK